MCKIRTAKDVLEYLKKELADMEYMVKHCVTNMARDYYYTTIIFLAPRILEIEKLIQLEGEVNG